MAHLLTRRTLLAAGAGLAGAGAIGGLAARELSRPRSGPAPAVPDAPPGDERLIRIRSGARGREVDFWTAVPEGYGDGRGLPVCLVLHGASATPRDYGRFGLARFLTDAVRRGAPPFVLAGATGGRLSWRPSGDDDPQRMVREELPTWCARRDFDTSRLAAWGWSMGGFGALLLAETYPGWLRAVPPSPPPYAPVTRSSPGWAGYGAPRSASGAAARTTSSRTSGPGSGAARAAATRRVGGRPAQLRLLGHGDPGRVRPAGQGSGPGPESLTPPALAGAGASRHTAQYA